jgi:hypothetical protein
LHELDDFVWVVVWSDAVLFSRSVHELNAQTALLEWLALHLIHEVGVPLHFLDVHPSEEWLYFFSLFVGHKFSNSQILDKKKRSTIADASLLSEAPRLARELRVRCPM